LYGARTSTPTFNPETLTFLDFISALIDEFVSIDDVNLLQQKRYQNITPIAIQLAYSNPYIPTAVGDVISWSLI
jgi:hypothetical protein